MTKYEHNWPRKFDSVLLLTTSGQHFLNDNLLNRKQSCVDSPVLYIILRAELGGAMDFSVTWQPGGIDVIENVELFVQAVNYKTYN